MKVSIDVMVEAGRNVEGFLTGAPFKINFELSFLHNPLSRDDIFCPSLPKRPKIGVKGKLLFPEDWMEAFLRKSVAGRDPPLPLAC